MGVLVAFTDDRDHPAYFKQLVAVEQEALDAARAAAPDAGLREALRFIADHGDEWTGSRAAYEAATALDASPAAPAGLDTIAYLRTKADKIEAASPNQAHDLRRVADEIEQLR
jgi:hypothetical protein